MCGVAGMQILCTFLSVLWETKTTLKKKKVYLKIKKNLNNIQKREMR